MGLLDLDIGRSMLPDDIQSRVEQTKEDLLLLKQNCLQGIQRVRDSNEILKNSADEFEKQINETLNRITDKVFVKQLNKMSSSSAALQTSNMSYEQACRIYEQFVSDVEAVVRSRIPTWMSSVIYTFNPNWRKEVYSNIRDNYLLLYRYICEQKSTFESKQREIVVAMDRIRTQAKESVDQLLSLITVIVSRYTLD